MSVKGIKKIKQNRKYGGVSLRTIQILLIAAAVIFSALMLFFTFYLSNNFQKITQTSEHHIELRKTALELMNASDYLTEKVQRFTVEGDTRFLDAYFEEADSLHRREDALSKLAAEKGNDAAAKKLQAAMDASMQLMNREYYAMRLVIEAKDIKDYPNALQSVALYEEDAALSAEQKMHRATQMVLDNDYYMKKNVIRSNMNDCLAALEKNADTADAAALKSFQTDMLLVRIVILLQTVGVVFLVWLTSHLGIHPILDAVERIKENRRIAESGTSEFRYLVRAYNRMYEVYKKSLERLGFKASHDELTGVYNRTGYDSILASVDLADTYLILFDIDNFKTVNDTYGHDIGDKILQKTAASLKNNFRSDDYICRIGGDEFVVFMVHADDSATAATLAEKIENINRELENTDDGLPAATLSVGIAHGSSTTDADILFRKADAAMYHSKHSGKKMYSFS